MCFRLNDDMVVASCRVSSTFSSFEKFGKLNCDFPII